MVQLIIVSVISVYPSRCRLDNSQKDNFYVSTTTLSTVRNLAENGIAVIAEDVYGHGHVGSIGDYWRSF